MGMKMCCLEGREGGEREREMLAVCITVSREINSPV